MKYVIRCMIGLLLIVWFYMGYLGWTWIPIGRRAKKGQIRVACVGDSITYGAMIKNWYCYNWPHLMQKLLGKKYCVHNYGLSGHTGMETGDYPYVKTFRYRRSLCFAPDIVFLMFGTNDSKPQNWKGQEEFYQQYEKLLKSYLELPKKPAVYLMMPPAPHHMNGETANTYSFDIQLNEIQEAGKAVRKLAENYGQSVIDLFSFTKNHPEWFVKDGIHPNAAGAGKIAELLARELETGKRGG